MKPPSLILELVCYSLRNRRRERNGVRSNLAHMHKKDQFPKSREKNQRISVCTTEFTLSSNCRKYFRTYRVQAGGAAVSYCPSKYLICFPHGPVMSSGGVIGIIPFAISMSAIAGRTVYISIVSVFQLLQLPPPLLRNHPPFHFSPQRRWQFRSGRSWTSFTEAHGGRITVSM